MSPADIAIKFKVETARLWGSVGYAESQPMQPKAEEGSLRLRSANGS